MYHFCGSHPTRKPNEPFHFQLKLYKFSMSWARVLPEADATKPNPAGVKFYHNLINAIVAKGMKVAVSKPTNKYSPKSALSASHNRS